MLALATLCLCTQEGGCPLHQGVFCKNSLFKSELCPHSGHNNSAPVRFSFFSQLTYNSQHSLGGTTFPSLYPLKPYFASFGLNASSDCFCNINQQLLKLESSGISISAETGVCVFSLRTELACIVRCWGEPLFQMFFVKQCSIEEMCNEPFFLGRFGRSAQQTQFFVEPEKPRLEKAFNLTTTLIFMRLSIQ